MAYAARSNEQDVLGCFVEKSAGNFFEFSTNPELTLAPPAHGGKNIEFPHRVWVTTPRDGIDSGWRYARVGKTVVHIIIDEIDDKLVVEKWNIKGHQHYE